MPERDEEGRRAADHRAAAEVAPRQVVLELAGASLPGDLTVPGRARGLVLFAHGSGSSGRSTRNRAVAATLIAGGLGTLLFDLLTVDEAADRRNVFDIELLGSRLVAAARWAAEQAALAPLPVGFFGASTGAAAALVAAAELGSGVSAVVSRGGRPDLAGPALERVTAPTLLLVGSLDVEVLALNRLALRRLRAPSELALVEGATHLFEEPGTLEEVARAALDWFARHLAR